MNCIKDKTIQRYIDAESSPEEVVRIEKHMATCEKCAQKVDYHKKRAVFIKSVINLLSEGDPEMRKMTLPSDTAKKTPYTGKRYIYSIAAACILLIVLFTYHDKRTEYPYETTIVNNLDWEIDANRTITQQKLVLQVIDPEGNIIEYPIN